MTEPSTIDVGGTRIAYAARPGRAPGVVWLGGFKSTMDGNKARALDAWAARDGRAFVRFDYFGHGRSGGDFRSGTITRWRDDGLTVLDALTEGPQILVGSSMGGWLALLISQLRSKRIAGLQLIAPAADFTEALLWGRLDEAAKRAILERGEWSMPSAYDVEPYPVTRSLIEDGRKHLLLDRGTLAIPMSVRVLQGMKDPDVPWLHCVRLVEAMEGDVHLTLIRDGDHRLSRPSDLKLLERSLDALIGDVASH